jgi:hypothetical protein
VRKLNQTILILSTLLASWMGMQAVHEFGHVLGAWLTGGQVLKVVLDPRTISRTDVFPNPQPLLVVWSGPIFGVLMPVILWVLAAAAHVPGTFVLRFFAGFCLVANGAYIAGGSFGGFGDCGAMLRHGSQPWQLWLFGAVTIPAGLGAWHGQASHFGFGRANGKVPAPIAYGCAAVSLMLAILGFTLFGE